MLYPALLGIFSMTKYSLMLPKPSPNPNPNPNIIISYKILRVGVNCSKFDCSTINWLTLLAVNQLLDTKFINCSNPVNPGSTRFKQLTKKSDNWLTLSSS